VDLFFVLSGFLITGILLDAKGTPHFFRNFYARRTVRIYSALLPRARGRGDRRRSFGGVPCSPAARGGINLWYWLYTSNIGYVLRGDVAGRAGTGALLVARRSRSSFISSGRRWCSCCRRAAWGS
jgi:hypothetical protein